MSAAKAAWETILRDAAHIANQKIKADAALARYSGEVVRPDFASSERQSTFTLMWERATKEDDKRISDFAYAAINESLVKNKEAFIGLIVADAREGKNFFDRLQRQS